jgi:hypothetical protein
LPNILAQNDSGAHWELYQFRLALGFGLGEDRIAKIASV